MGFGWVLLVWEYGVCSSAMLRYECVLAGEWRVNRITMEF